MSITGKLKKTRYRKILKAIRGKRKIILEEITVRLTIDLPVVTLFRKVDFKMLKLK